MPKSSGLSIFRPSPSTCSLESSQTTIIEDLTLKIAKNPTDSSWLDMIYEFGKDNEGYLILCSEVTKTSLFYYARDVKIEITNSELESLFAHMNDGWCRQASDSEILEVRAKSPVLNTILECPSTDSDSEEDAIFSCSS